MFDVTDRESFLSLRSWVNAIEEHAGVRVVKYLVANKIDLADERVVSKEEGENFAQQYLMQYCETSAKTGSGIANNISKLATEIFLKKPVEKPSFILNGGKHKDDLKKKKCC